MPAARQFFRSLKTSLSITKQFMQLYAEPSSCKVRRIIDEQLSELKKSFQSSLGKFVERTKMVVSEMKNSSLEQSSDKGKAAASAIVKSWRKGASQNDDCEPVPVCKFIPGGK